MTAGVDVWLNTPQPPLEASGTSGMKAALYDKLERVVLPLFYRERERFLEVMVHAIALNGSFFNTHRMMQQYVLKAYF